MSQKLLPSGHLMELFMPYRFDEKRLLDVTEEATGMGFYKNVEVPIMFDPENRRKFRNIIERNHVNATTFATPNIKDFHYSLCDLDESRRRAAVDFTKSLVPYAAEMNMTTFGICNGDDPGPAFRGPAKAVLRESLLEIAEYAKSYGMNITLEPLDRYAFKKQLIGPMEETVNWFKPIREECPNAFLHWDSAHEALGLIDLNESLDLAEPYIGQMHLCNAIVDPSHPCFGDLHMDVPRAPEWKTEGFLTPEVGAEILKKAAGFDTPENMEHVYVSVEVQSHPGDDMWLKEQNSRAFLIRCFELAGLDLD